MINSSSMVLSVLATIVVALSTMTAVTAQSCTKMNFRNGDYNGWYKDPAYFTADGVTISTDAEHFPLVNQWGLMGVQWHESHADDEGAIIYFDILDTNRFEGNFVFEMHYVRAPGNVACILPDGTTRETVNLPRNNQNPTVEIYAEGCDKIVLTFQGYGKIESLSYCPPKECPAVMQGIDSGSPGPIDVSDGNIEDWDTSDTSPQFIHNMNKYGDPNNIVGGKFFAQLQCESQALCVLAMSGAYKRPNSFHYKYWHDDDSDMWVKNYAVSNQPLVPIDNHVGKIYDGQGRLLAWEACYPVTPGQMGEFEIRTDICWNKGSNCGYIASTGYEGDTICIDTTCPAATSAPTGSPVVEPTTSPTGSPVATPTTSPTGSPVATPTTSPTGSPVATPTGSPVVAPTGSPTLGPTTIPPAGLSPPTDTSEPTSAPIPSPAPPCPGGAADVMLIKHFGGDSVSFGELPISVLTRGENYVEFVVTNTFEKVLEQTYIQYEDLDKNTQCVRKDTVEILEQDVYKAVCMQHNKIATVNFFVSDASLTSAVDSGVEVPKCCHGPENDTNPKEHYVFEILCVCPDDASDARRNLRGL